VRRFQDSLWRCGNVLRYSGPRQGGGDDSDGATGENAEQRSEPHAVGVQRSSHRSSSVGYRDNRSRMEDDEDERAYLGALL
jgi:hypothetical protein